MAQTKAFASLSPRLLARKGSAKPAMRPQVAPLVDFPSATPHSLDDDLGWNDMGEAADLPARPVQVFPLSNREAVVQTKPEVLVRRQILARTMARSAKASGPALPKRKHAAFTLRIDPERHSKLRLACSVKQRSAQQLLTEALDTILQELAEIQPAAGKADKRR